MNVADAATDDDDDDGWMDGMLYTGVNVILMDYGCCDEYSNCVGG